MKLEPLSNDIFFEGKSLNRNIKDILELFHTGYLHAYVKTMNHTIYLSI